MSCICPPGTKSSFSQSVDNLIGDISIALPDMSDTEYLRGVVVSVTCPEYYGRRFSIGDPVFPTRLYEAGFLSFIMDGGAALPEYELQWANCYFFTPEGAKNVRLWINSGCFCSIDFDVWNCPTDEEEPPPPPPDEPQG